MSEFVYFQKQNVHTVSPFFMETVRWQNLGQGKPMETFNIYTLPYNNIGCCPVLIVSLNYNDMFRYVYLRSSVVDTVKNFARTPFPFEV